ncbi:MAG: 2-oxo-4-hydroxy-4-carboxy-5-ureidoimidazoline decarboxylase [Acidobacteriota bacterium]
MRLDDLNALDPAAAALELRRCCGSERWAREMAMKRPWPDVDALAVDADVIWRRLAEVDHLQAFDAHPRIGSGAEAGGSAASGERRTGERSWSAQEQSRVAAASDEVRDRLAAANDEYLARFGFIFIVCATGKSAEEMLAMVDERLTHSRMEELQIAADEQGKIMQLRLRKLVSSEDAGKSILK